MVTTVSEICSYLLTFNNLYRVRYALYHGYNVAQAVIISSYYIALVAVNNKRKLFVWSTIIWLLTGLLNMLFLQPLNSLNNNILMIESFSFITMSLFVVYRRLRDSRSNHIFRDSHFQIAGVFLILWSSSYFFWAFVKILYGARWPYMKTVMHVMEIINIGVYSGFGLILFFYPKNKPIENR
jgi:hypothetical protein